MGIGIEYYAFALFIAALISLIALLFKLLFANVKQHNKMLDEKEAKLLQLYRTVESIMEEFNDQVKTAMEDIKECEVRAAAQMAVLAKPPEPPEPLISPEKTDEAEWQPRIERQGKSMTVDSSIIRAASEVLERAERMVKSSSAKSAAPPANHVNGEVIQRLFDDTVSDQQASGSEAQIMKKRRESILALAEEGKKHAQIAQELGITQNEVKLVIGLIGR